jgi:hypothetical protein
MAGDALELTVEGEIWFWRGPSPFHFVTVPEPESASIRAIAPLVTYGWGMVPTDVRLGRRTWRTALIPKDGTYLVPIKDAIRRAERVDQGDTVSLELVIRP